MSLRRPVDLRETPTPVVNELIEVPGSAPFKADLVEVPDSMSVVRLRRITDSVKAGTGSGNILSGGFCSGIVDRNYRVEIDTAGDMGTATFRWSNDGGVNWQGTLVPIADASTIELELGVEITPVAGAGQDYDLGDYFTFTAECWTEVNVVPTATKQYQVNYSNGRITFYSGDASKYLYASYQGKGTVVRASDIVQLVETLDRGEVVARNLDTSMAAVNKAVYIKSDGTLDLASSDGPDTLAFAFVKVSDETEGELLSHGRLGGFVGLTKGAVYYLGVGGDITPVPPAIYRQVVGRAWSDTELFVSTMLEQVVDQASAVYLKGVNTGGFDVRRFVGRTSMGGFMNASCHWSTAMSAIGCVKVADMNYGVIVRSGILGGFAGLVPGTRYFLSESGGVRSTVPGTSGDIIQVVGWGWSATELLVEVDPNYTFVP